jgi:hypothetical protein
MHGGKHNYFYLYILSLFNEAFSSIISILLVEHFSPNINTTVNFYN